jgi:hypothetical protein
MAASMQKYPPTLFMKRTSPRWMELAHATVA